MDREQTKYTDLSSWVDSRQAQGFYFFSRDEALETINFSEDAFKHAAARLVKKTRIGRVHGGFFVIIPLEYAATGLIPPEWFIGDLMEYIGQPFYVGLLSAAVFHGAAHQRPQQFQVVTTKPLREIRIKNQSIRFFVKTGFEETPRTQFKVQTGLLRFLHRRLLFLICYATPGRSADLTGFIPCSRSWERKWALPSF